MGKFNAPGVGRGITDYRSNSIINQQMAEQYRAADPQQFRQVLVNQTNQIMADETRRSTNKHKNSCVACPLCQKKLQSPGILASLAKMIFG